MIGKKFVLWTELRLMVLAAAAVLLVAAASTKSAYSRQNENSRDAEIHVLPVRGNVYMLVGDGGNIAVQVGTDGALVVDSGAGQLSDKVIAEIKKLLHQGNVRRIILKNDKGETLIEIPLTFGVVGAIGGAWRTWQGGRVDSYFRLDLLPFPGFSGGPLVAVTGAFHLVKHIGQFFRQAFG